MFGEEPLLMTLRAQGVSPMGAGMPAVPGGMSKPPVPGLDELLGKSGQYRMTPDGSILLFPSPRGGASGVPGEPVQASPAAPE
jgi:hypothetical protein